MNPLPFILLAISLPLLLGGCAKDDRPICPSCGERATMIMHPRMPEIAEMGWAQTHYKCENQHNFTKDGELVDVFGNPLKKKKPLTKADPKFSGDKLVPEESVAETKPAEAVSVSPHLKYETEGDAVTFTGCDKKASGALIIPATIEGKPVTSIGESAFGYCSNRRASRSPTASPASGRVPSDTAAT